jgi:DNA-binding response OmpR family regulator/anti-sigma regulatory factor (Ser/Thr protein kinase)
LVNNNVKRLNQLVEELLEISKLDAGKQELELQPLYLYPYLRQLFYAFESAAETKSISYQFDYQLKEDLVIAIDPKRFSKVVNNLLSNAIKFTPKNGKVEMRITEIPNADYRNIKIEVEDSGRGIPPEDMEHVFDRYFQTKRKSIPTEGGTGIGLALAKELAQLMQGDLNVKSEWGKGSSFTFTMLAEEKDASIAVNQEVIKAKNEQSQKTSTVSFNQNLPKVLIVEDNLDMQQLISSILSDDYQCVIADNGEEAWNMLQHNDPKIKDVQLMVSDLMMPIMDGFSLLEKVKQDENWRHLPVIMLTARSSEETKLKALRLGVDDYLSKPFSPDELLARTSNLLDNFLQKKEYREEQQKLDVAFEEVSSADQQWLAEIEEAALDALEKKMELNSAYLSEKMLLSERQLLRKLKALTGLSIKKYVQEIRLQKARHLLENKVFNTVSEVAYACGINTPSYLSKLYLNRFGKRPAEYLEQLI